MSQGLHTPQHTGPSLAAVLVILNLVALANVRQQFALSELFDSLHTQLQLFAMEGVSMEVDVWHQIRATVE